MHKMVVMRKDVKVAKVPVFVNFPRKLEKAIGPMTPIGTDLATCGSVTLHNYSTQKMIHVVRDDNDEFLPFSSSALGDTRCVRLTFSVHKIKVVMKSINLSIIKIRQKILGAPRAEPVTAGFMSFVEHFDFFSFPYSVLFASQMAQQGLIFIQL